MNLPEDILFHIGQYGIYTKVSDKRWYEEILGIDPTFDLRVIYALRNRWTVRSNNLSSHDYWPIYELIKDNWFILYKSRISIQSLSPEKKDKLINLLRREGYTYNIDDVNDIVIEDAGSLIAFLQQAIAHTLENPTRSYLSIMRYPHDRTIEYIGISGYTSPQDMKISIFPPLPFDQQVLDAIKELDGSFSLQNEYTKRYTLLQSEIRLPSDIKSIVLKYREGLREMIHTIQGKTIVYLPFDIEEPIGKSFVFDDESYQISIDDPDQSIYNGIVSLLWNRQPFIIDEFNMITNLIPI